MLQAQTLCSTYIQALIDRRVSRLRNFLLTGILPYTGFTFAVPEHPSYILLYISARLSRYSFRVSRLHKSLFYRLFAVYRIHFRRA
jgi:hypothetical protein